MALTPINRKEQWYQEMVDAFENNTTIESLSVTENGTYTAPSGTAYSPVTVNFEQTTVSALSVTENGTYTAPSGTAYSPVTVEVANSYSDEDEGMVVQDGELVEQTSLSVTTNDTYDTTTVNEVTVNVSGGGAEVIELGQYYDSHTITIPFSCGWGDGLYMFGFTFIGNNVGYSGVLAALGGTWSIYISDSYQAVSVSDTGNLIITGVNNSVEAYAVRVQQ